MSAEARAARKIAAGLYANLPPRETFAAATEYERARQQAIGAIDTSLIQRAQVAMAVLTNEAVPRIVKDEKKLAATVEAAREFTTLLLVQGCDMMAQREKLMADEYEGEEEPVAQTTD